MFLYLFIYLSLFHVRLNTLNLFESSREPRSPFRLPFDALLPPTRHTTTARSVLFLLHRDLALFLLYHTYPSSFASSVNCFLSYIFVSFELTNKSFLLNNSTKSITISLRSEDTHDVTRSRLTRDRFSGIKICDS